MDSSSDAPTDTAMRGPHPHYANNSVVSALTTQQLGNDDFVEGEMILCGRGNQLEILQAASERVKTGETSEVILVEGASGTGKSALVESIRDSVIQNDAGFFVGGKFDQLQAMTEPFSAIAGSLSDLCDLMLQSEQLPEWRERITSSLGSEGCKVLSRVVSSLDSLLKKEDEVEEASEDHPTIDRHDFSRFRIVWRQFLRAVATKDHPVILFLDDLQWADEMSIRLIKALIEDKESSNLLLCIAYRSNEVNGEAILQLDVDGGEHLPYTKITTGNLGHEDLSTMLSQLLYINGNTEGPLTNIILEKTNGNPNAVVQLLQLLKTKNLLTFSNETYSWEWNINAIESEVADNPSEIIAQKLDRLDQKVVGALKLAAYIGNSFNIDALHHVVFDKQESLAVDEDAVQTDNNHPSHLRDYLEAGVGNGIIEKADGATYKFCHDSIQHFLYHSVEAEADREHIHLRIAIALIKWLESNVERQEWLILLATSNVTQGAKHITDEEERLVTRRLCAEAAALFASKISLPDTRKCLECAINLEKEEDWVSNYGLCIDIRNAYAETLGGTGFFEECDQAVDLALRRAKTFKDKLRAQSARLRSLISRRQYDDAVAWTCDVIFKDIGLKFLKRPSAGNVIMEFLRVKMATRKMKPEDYLRLPEVEDEKKLGAMKVLTLITTVVHVTDNSMLLMYMTFRGLRFYLESGNSPFFGPLPIAHVLVVMDKFDEAYELMKVSMTIAERGDFNPTSRCLALAFAYCNITPWRDELSASIPPLLESYELGMKNSADLAGSFFGLASYLDLRFHVGIPLKEVEEEARRFCLLAKEVQANQMLPTMTTVWQAVLNLLGKSDDPVTLTGEAMTFEVHVRTAREQGDRLSVQMALMYRLYLEVSFEEWEAASKTMFLFLENYATMKGHYAYMLCSSLVCLSALKSYEETKKSKFRRIARRHRQMIWKWTKRGVPTAPPLRSLVDAEWAAVVEKGESEKALRSFEEAIEGFESKRLVYFETLACERAMHLMIQHMRLTKARGFMSKSVERNREWGNRAKVEHLENTYQEVLRNVAPAFEVKVTHNRKL